MGFYFLFMAFHKEDINMKHLSKLNLIRDQEFIKGSSRNYSIRYESREAEGEDLSNVSIPRVIFYDVDFSKASFNNANLLSCRFEKCKFANTVFSNTNLTSALFENCTFNKTKVDGATFGHEHIKFFNTHRTSFSRCVLKNVDFTKIVDSSKGEYQLQSDDFYQCHAKNCLGLPKLDERTCPEKGLFFTYMKVGNIFIRFIVPEDSERKYLKNGVILVDKAFVNGYEDAAGNKVNLLLEEHNQKQTLCPGKEISKAGQNYYFSLFLTKEDAVQEKNVI